MPTNSPENQPTPEQREAITRRMDEKQKWKELPGNRYTADELNEMIQSLRSGRDTVGIIRRTGIVYHV